MRALVPEFCKGAVLGAALFAWPVAAPVAAEVPDAARQAQVVFLGEQHDNPTHHAVQADWVRALQPAALVFEMLTPAQAARGAAPWSTQGELDALLGWTGSPWPDFSLYFPIFEAAPDAVIYGAGVPRDEIRKALERPLAQHPAAVRFGLAIPAPAAEQSAREALQGAAHCDMLPENLLPYMVDAQRLRDLALADAALRALDHTGGPVVVITGNGHARMDWGAPALLRYARGDVTVFALGQSEGGALNGAFDQVNDATPPPRDDPCAAFTKSD